ncbi:autophagy protein [Xylaria cf. heliscus]|nr:autophagy protein [Xylaria cf. heliscus]
MQTQSQSDSTDTPVLGIDVKPAGSSGAQLDESEKRVAPDQFDERYRTTQKEIYAYYCYYIGCSGLSLFSFAPSAFQNLLNQAAGSEGFLPFVGRLRSVDSIVLLSTGISFAIQTVFFLAIGSFADFGCWRPNILIVQSFIAYAIGFAWLGVYDKEKWHVAVWLYIVGLIVYQTTYTFWNAAFPGLARNTPDMKDKADAYVAGTITRDEYDYADSMMRGRLANVAFCIQSFAEVIILAIAIGIMFGLKVRDSEANNNWGLSVIIALGSAVWVIVSLPWFFLEKRRPGQNPGKRSIIIAGLWQFGHAMKAIWKLKQSLIFLIGYFLLGDSLNTTFSVISILQNDIVTYDALELTYLLLAGIAAQGLGIFSFWYCQKRLKLGTKTMFDITAVATVFLDAWGMVGIWTDRFGFHNLWEFWLYFGFLVCPWYSYSQIMISEVTPRGYEFLFFSLFSIVGKASSFIGPLVCSAIVDADASHNNSTPFYFLFSLSLASCIVLVLFVDLQKSQVEQEKFLKDKAKHLKENIQASSLEFISRV